jgi:hypothetical protein
MLLWVHDSATILWMTVLHWSMVLLLFYGEVLQTTHDDDATNGGRSSYQRCYVFVPPGRDLDLLSLLSE